MAKKTLDFGELGSEGTEQKVNYDLTPEEQVKADERLKKQEKLFQQTEEESEKAKKIAAEKSKELKEGGVEKLKTNYKLYIDWIEKGKNNIDGLEIDGFKISTENVITEIYAKRDLATWFTDLIGTTRNYLIREEVYRFIVAIKDGMKRRCVIGKNGKVYFEYDSKFEEQLKNDPKKYIKDSYAAIKKIKVNTPNTDLSNMGDNGRLSNFDD